jgi:chorismate mutase
MVDGLMESKLLIAGPCGAESEAQLMETARAIATRFPGAWFRAGVWKPRTRPGAFEGVGEPALEWMQKVRHETGLKVVTEAATTHQLEACLKAGIDGVWIGARTTVNPFLVQDLADAMLGISIPVMVKNPLHPDVDLWRGAIERVGQSVKGEVIAIHRGFHSFETSEFRNHPRWQVAFELKSFFPGIRMVCDISHIAGRRPLLRGIAQEALDLGYDGWMIETHIDPDNALSDKMQQVTPDQLAELLHGLSPRISDIGNGTAATEIMNYRSEIDRLDEALLQLMQERMKLSARIGEVKKENDISIFQPDRWRHILSTLRERGNEIGLSPGFIRNLLIQIHDESIRIQSEIVHRDELKNVGRD